MFFPHLLHNTEYLYFFLSMYSLQIVYAQFITTSTMTFLTSKANNISCLQIFHTVNAKRERFIGEKKESRLYHMDVTNK